MKNTIRILSLMLVVGLCVFNVTDVKADDAKKYEQQAQKEQKKADKLKEQQENVTEEKAELKKKLSKLASSIKETTEKLEEKQVEITKIQDDLDAAKIDEHQQYEDMKLRIQFMYEQGDNNVLEYLFEAKSIADLLNKAEYVRVTSEYDREKLMKFQDVVSSIAETEKVLQQEEKELQDLQDTLLVKQKEAEALVEEADLELASLEKELGEAQKKVKSLLAQAKKAKQQQQSIAASNGSAGASQIIGTGELAWPTTSKRVTSYYGGRVAPVAGATSWHDAIDIGASIGTPVYSVKDGTVITASYGYNGGRGNYVMVDHGNGLVTRYQHLSDIYVSVGQTVSKGQNIAAVGNTGASSGPHLDYAIYVNGKTVDPLTYY